MYNVQYVKLQCVATTLNYVQCAVCKTAMCTYYTNYVQCALCKTAMCSYYTKLHTNYALYYVKL